MRVVLIGGTSNVGKSTVAEVVAGRLGFACRSTDLLARHPGRPWRSPGWEVPPHVAEHYATLSVDELIVSVLDHYERLWPRIEDIVRAHPGLVLEGSALWPARVATLDLPDVTAVWLTADDTVLRNRIHAAAGHPADDRVLVDRFLARTLRFQELVLADLDRLGLRGLPVDGRSADDLAGLVLDPGPRPGTRVTGTG